MAAKDQAVSSLLIKHRLMIEYTIADSGLHCYVSFDGGKIVSAFSKPSRQAELAFVSKATTLDRLLRGEDCLSEMEVALHLGVVRKLSLRRDLKKIRAGLAHVYSSACDRISADTTTLALANAR